MTTIKRVTSAKPKRGSHLVMVLPDLHLPNHDPRALAVAMKCHKILKPQRTVILGDWLEADQFSKWPKQARFERAQDFFEYEIKPCNQLLDDLQKNTDELVFIEGNHEWRVERYLAGSDPVVKALGDYISPRALLSQGRKKFDWVPYSDPGATIPHYKIANDLIAVHGWSHSTHASAKHLDMARSFSVIHGHTHRAQSHTARNPVTGKILKGWSVGCLSSLSPKWAHGRPTNWVHGLSLIYVRNDLEDWTDYNVLIREGTVVLPGGEKISA